MPKLYHTETHIYTIFHYVLLLGRGTRSEGSSAGLNDQKTSASRALHKACSIEWTLLAAHAELQGCVMYNVLWV